VAFLPDFPKLLGKFLGIQSGQFSLSAAIGLFNNIINFALLLTINKVSKKMTNVGIV